MPYALSFTTTVLPMVFTLILIKIYLHFMLSKRNQKEKHGVHRAEGQSLEEQMRSATLLTPGTTNHCKSYNYSQKEGDCSKILKPLTFVPQHQEAGK